jgi:hypothetical protein
MSRLVVFAIGILLFAGCTSSQIKARKEMRDKVAMNSKFYCDFISGSQHHDTEIQLNLEMAKRCDGDKPFSISQFRTQSDVSGVMYCCSTNATAFLNSLEGKTKPANPAKAADKKDDKKDEKKLDPKDELSDDDK